jgi:hypothetical protein
MFLPFDLAEGPALGGEFGGERFHV